MKLTDKIRTRLKKRYSKAPSPSAAAAAVAIPEVLPQSLPPPAKASPRVSTSGDVLVADGRAWVRVRGSKSWRPTCVGETLTGELVGRSTRPGGNGSVYGVASVRTAEGVRTVSGVVITGLFESAGCAPGTAVRIVYRGDHVSPHNGRTWRDFDLYLAKDEAKA